MPSVVLGTVTAIYKLAKQPCPHEADGFLGRAAIASIREEQCIGTQIQRKGDRKWRRECMQLHMRIIQDAVMVKNRRRMKRNLCK